MAKFVFSAFADEAGNSLDEQIKALVDNGIHYIEPRNIDGKCIIDFSDEELLEIKRRLNENGIQVGSVGSPIGKYAITDDFDAYLPKVKRTIEVAKLLGTKYIRMFSFFVKQDELAIHRDEVIRRLREMVKLAEAEGVVLCHENESKIYGQMPQEVKDLLTSVPGLGGIFDAANYRMNNADVDEGLKATFIRPAYMHVKDAIFESQTIVPAGEGEGKISEAIKAFDAAIDGKVMLTLEPHLHVFAAYKDIDHHELRGKYSFKNNREPFDFAANALKNIMIENGYRRSIDGMWKR